MSSASTLACSCPGACACAAAAVLLSALLPRPLLCRPEGLVGPLTCGRGGGLVAVGSGGALGKPHGSARREPSPRAAQPVPSQAWSPPLPPPRLPRAPRLCSGSDPILTFLGWLVCAPPPCGFALLSLAVSARAHRDRTSPGETERSDLLTSTPHPLAPAVDSCCV